jgi:tetratricopeptide (TPR) repeat protein
LTTHPNTQTTSTGGIATYHSHLQREAVMMSANKVEELEAADEEEVCASCGIAAVDDIKLKFCDDCDLVKYCSDKCQENHRERHEEECKKQKAELHYKRLFSQPDSSYLGECPICCLPLPVEANKSTTMSCCSKSICKGCNYANRMREIEEGLEHRCAFCREPTPNSDEKARKQAMKRIMKHNDPVAMTQMGKIHYGEGNFVKALDYWTKAAELGDVAGIFCLGSMYFQGEGVEKDEKKAVYHLEQAAIGGHPLARGLLAIHEAKNGRPDRAAKHYIIAANLGDDISLKAIKDHFVKGVVSKEEYAAALRGYQAAVNETKSAEREKGEAFYARK